MDTLLRHPEWSSWINLSGQEYPLHSIAGIEERVAGLNGQPDVEVMDLNKLRPLAFETRETDVGSLKVM